MTRFSAASVIAAFLLMVGVNTADARYCGALRHGCCKPSCCQPTCCYTVMKMCKETVYDEEERTLYRTVYKEVMDERIIDAVEYVEETRYRCRPCTTWQPQAEPCCESVDCCEPVESCGPAKGCASGDCCEAAKPLKMVPVEFIKKVPYTVVVPKKVQKVKQVPRTVVTTEPYTVTVCIPRTVYKEVPVRVCCPIPRCKQPKCCGTACTSCGG